MNERDASTDRASGADDRMIAHIRDGYAPAPLSPSRRVQIEDQLWNRIEKRKLRRYFVPVLVTATAAALVTLLALPWTQQLKNDGAAPPSGMLTSAGQSVAVIASGVADESWELALLYPSDAAGEAALDADSGLPDEYLGIAAVLADG
jgi:hypothetical protein